MKNPTELCCYRENPQTTFSPKKKEKKKTQTTHKTILWIWAKSMLKNLFACIVDKSSHGLFYILALVHCFWQENRKGTKEIFILFFWKKRFDKYCILEILLFVSSCKMSLELFSFELLWVTRTFQGFRSYRNFLHKKPETTLNQMLRES